MSRLPGGAGAHAVTLTIGLMLGIIVTLLVWPAVQAAVAALVWWWLAVVFTAA